MHWLRSALVTPQHRQMRTPSASVCPEFGAGAGLSSLREQFSQSLCSQWLSSAPHKPLQRLTTVDLTAVRGQHGTILNIMWCFVLSLGDENIKHWEGLSSYLSLSVIKMFYQNQNVLFCSFFSDKQLCLNVCEPRGFFFISTQTLSFISFESR